MGNVGVIAALLCAATLVLGAGPAAATGTLECSAVDAEDVALSVLLSRLPEPLLSPLRAEFAVADRTFATDAAEGATPIVPLHAYSDAHGLVLEYLDAAATDVLVSLRLVRGAAADRTALAGVLVVRDVGAFAVTCLEG
jgi:hypothetical protein